MEEQHMMNDEIEIDLREIFGLFLRRIKLLILCGLIGALAAGGVTKFAITSQYTATSMIFILTKTTSVTSLADIQLGSELTSDFLLLATSRPTLEKVIDELGLEETTAELKNMVAVSNPSDTRILQISVTDPDPETAAKIANAMADATAESVAEVMSTDRPSIVERAVKPGSPSSPNLFKNILLGGMGAVFLVMAILVLRFLMDDTIKNEDDVEKYLGLHTLAALPTERKKNRSQRKDKREQKE